MLDYLQFEELKKDLPDLKVVLIMPEEREGNYLYSTDLEDPQRVKDTWDIIKMVGIEYAIEHPEVLKDLDMQRKFFYGIVRSINVAYNNRTWETKDSLLVNLKKFGEGNLTTSEG